MIRHAILALLASGSIYVAGSSPAAAFAYPYCLQSQKAGTVCEYASYEQCMASASGLGAECIVNPVVAFAERAQPYPRPPRVRRGYAY